jgi:Lysozyme like domain
MAAPKPGMCQSSLGTGTIYSYAQLEGLWINAGGSSSMAPLMAAIAMAESGGCTVAYNPSGATGLWQILGVIDPADKGHLTDPAVNAKEAVAKYKAQGLGAWQTYTNGAYRQFLNSSTTPDTNVPGSSAATGGKAQPCAATCLACVNLPSLNLGVTSVGAEPFCLFTKTEARAFIGAVMTTWGGVIMLIGLAVLTVSALGKTGAGGTAAKAGGTAAEGAGAALALAGFPEVGAPVAAIGSGLKKGQGRAGKYASGKRASARQATAASQKQAQAEQSRRDRAAEKAGPAKGRHATPKERGDSGAAA